MPRDITKAEYELKALHRYINTSYHMNYLIGEMNYSMGAISEYLNLSLNKEEIELAISTLDFYMDLIGNKMSPELKEAMRTIKKKLYAQSHLFVEGIDGRC